MSKNIKKVLCLKEDILKRIDRTVSDYHIEDLMGRSVFALSGGEKQKIACASSSVLLPGIMVLDEQIGRAHV